MISKILKFWKDYKFEIYLVSSIIVLIIYAIHRRGKRGTWSSRYVYVSHPKVKKKSAPKVSSGEAECRRVIETFFKKPFPNSRPDILRNPVTGGNFNLELDCYNPELKVAVEYNGAQHYKYVPYFHKNKEAFTNQKYRDELKRRMCRDHNILLIEVPYTVKIDNIESFIINKLRKNGYK